MICRVFSLQKQSKKQNDFRMLLIYESVLIAKAEAKLEANRFTHNDDMAQCSH